MINKAFVALIFSFPCSLLWAGQSHYKEGATIEEKNTQDRCDVLNSLAKKHAEVLEDAKSNVLKKVPNVGDLYSMNFTYNAFSHVAKKVQQTPETLQRVRNAEQVYSEAEQGFFKGEAKDKAISSAFYEVNGILKTALIRAKEEYPECNIQSGGTTTPTAAKPAAKPISTSETVR